VTRVDPRLVPTLTGARVRLVPLSTAHIDGLVAASSEDRASYAWTSVPAADSMETYVREILVDAAADLEVPFVQVRVVDDAVVGATRFLHLRERAVEIGGTWLAASAQRTGINREAKLLLLTYAFDTAGVDRVDLVTDARNVGSRTAIAGIGATFEGVLRCWQPSRVPGEAGRMRDSAIFSVIRPEWPRVRDALAAGLR
jgi:RimJ/RimL family protein N-acetyltransferase